MLGRNWFDVVIHERERDRLKAVFARLTAGKINPASYFENHVLTSGGDERLIAWHNTIMTDDSGNIVGTLSSGEDITERRRLEQTVSQGEARLRLLYERAPVGYQSLDENANLIDVNQAWLDKLGYTREEVIGRNFGDFLHPDWVDHFKENFSRFKAIGEVIGSDFEMRKKDGSLIAVSFTGRIGHDAQGRFLQTHCIFHDVTDRKRAEEALHRSEEQYRLVVDNAAEVICIVQDGMIKFANPRIEEVTGYTLGQMRSRPFADCIHPDDRPAVVERFRRNWAGEDLTGIFQCRAIRQDGRIRWLEVKPVTVQWEGRPAALSFITDVTDRREAERERDRLFDLSLDMLAVSGFDGFFRQLNPAWTATLGWTEGELLIRPWLEYVHPEDRPATIAMSDQLRQGRPVYSFENRYQCRDGSYRWISWKSFPLPDEKLIFTVARDITKRKAAEEALQNSEEYLRSLFNSSPDAIVTLDPDRKIVRTNQAFGSLFGYTQEEIIGRSMSLLHPSEESFKAFGDQVYPAVRRAGSWRGEWEFRRKDGSYVPVEKVTSTLKRPDGVLGGYVSIIRDITERQRAEEALRESEYRFRQLFDNMGDGVAIYRAEADGRDFVLVDHNRAGDRISQVNRDDVVGRNVTDVFPGVKELGLFEVFQKVWRTGRPEHHKVSRYQDDRISIWVENYVFKLPSGEIVAIYEDVTERKKAEERERIHQEQLYQSAKLASLGTLVSGVAHEVNNPNNFIMLNAKTLARVWDDVQPILEQYHHDRGSLELAGLPFEEARSEIGQMIQDISQGSERIKKIVESLRDFARQDRGSMDEPVDINEVVTSAMVIVENLVKKSVARFNLDLNPDLPRLIGNHQRLEQVIINLLTNSCRALTGRPGHLNVSTNYDPDNGRLVVRVSDNGKGIEPGDLPYIKDPFYTTERDSGGMGLGLSISHNIIEAHRGTLDFTSQPGVGTTVSLTLPAMPEDRGRREGGR